MRRAASFVNALYSHHLAQSAAVLPATAASSAAAIGATRQACDSLWASLQQQTRLALHTCRHEVASTSYGSLARTATPSGPTQRLAPHMPAWRSATATNRAAEPTVLRVPRRHFSEAAEGGAGGSNKPRFTTTSEKSQRGAMDTAFYVTAIAIGMLGLSYASVPLYRMFCAATGYGGTAQKGKVCSLCGLNFVRVRLSHKA